MLSRADVINHFIGAFQYERYLEIGVQAGVTFNAVQCINKVAVDPCFGVELKDIQGTPYAMTSDAYFDEHPDARFDIVFIDGLHTLDQSLRDFTRSLLRIPRTGLILIDDAFPSDYLAADRSLEFCNGIKTAENWPDRNWMGDVFKTALFINEFFDQLSLCYIADTLGIVAVWYEPRRVAPIFGDTAVEGIARCEFSRFKYEAAPRIPKMSVVDVTDSLRRARAPEGNQI